MEEEKIEKNKKPIFVFFWKMFFIFLGIDLISIFISNIIGGTSFVEKYGQELIVELFYGLTILVVMLLFKNSYVFTNKKDKFSVGIKIAGPMLIVIAINLLSSISSLTYFSIGKFINVLVYCLFIGIAEEFLCRGWLQNEFIERYSDSKKSVIYSIVLASLVFGLMHITNLMMQNAFETVLQIINATALGVLLGSIYYKTKNIWSVIFLHSFYDFAIFLGEMNYVKDCTYNTPTLGITIVNGIQILIISAIWILAAVLVLRKASFPDKKPSRSSDNQVRNIIIILFIALFIPIESLVPEYDNYQVCYKYNEIEPLENYTLYFPYYNDYSINYSKEIKDESGNTIEEKTEELFDYKFTLNDDATISIRNNITNYETKLKYIDVYNFEILENKDNYLVIIQTLENESTVYYSDFITKNDIEQGSDYLEKFKESFIKYELPTINNLGYATIDDTNNKYPYMIGETNSFIIKNGELYLIKDF